MKISIKIGTLLSAIQKFKEVKLVNEKELLVSDLYLKIKSPSLNYVSINYVIKKHADGVKITFGNKNLICAKKHILYNDIFLPSFAENFKIGDSIQTIKGLLKIDNIEYIEAQDFYDVSLDAPHVYVDSNGIIHHNSLVTAILSKKVEKYGRSIVIVPNKDLITQTEKYYIDLGLDVGVYYGDRKDFFKQHTICTWQSLERLRESPIEIGLSEPVTFEKFIQGVVAVIVDECHGIRAEKLSSLLSRELAHIPIRWAVTGTVPKDEYEIVHLTIGIGEVLYKLSTNSLQEKGIISNCEVKVIQLIDTLSFSTYPSELDYLVTEPKRVKFMADLIMESAKSGNVLVLVGRKETGKLMESMIPDSIFLSGATKSKTRKEHYDEVSLSDSKVIIATSGIAAVGIDIPRVNHLFLIEPGKSFIRTIQSIGRALRTAHDKDSAIIWDICSSCKWSKGHLAKRKKYYKEQMFPFTIDKIVW